MIRQLALALAGLLAGGGSAGAVGAAPVVDPRVQELAARVVELQKKSVMAELEIERLRKRVAALEIELERRSAAAAPAEAAAAAPPATAPADTSAGQPPPVTAAAIEESDLDPEPAPPPAPPSAAPVPSPPTGEAVPSTPVAGSPSPPPPERPVSAAAQALYDRGYTLYHQGQYAEAEAVFQRFLEAQGDTELGDNAWYWIGASRLARKDNQGALTAFQTLVERYPQGNKVPDALLKMGRCLEALGDPTAARAAFDELRRRYPDSPAAAALVPAPPAP